MSEVLAFELNEITRSFGSGRNNEPSFYALRDVRLRIPAGGLTTVVGPSGSGKSTLLGLLGLLDRPTSGEMRVAGVDVSRANERSRCAIRAGHLGFVFQAFHLMSRRTVEDNVMLGGLYRGLSRSQRQREARDVLATVGLGQKRADRAETLSGGERQRVAIARALVGSPDVLLCDEPTGNLDSVNGEIIVDLLRDLASEGMTVILVTHDHGIAALGERTITVRDGRVSGDGAF